MHTNKDVEKLADEFADCQKILTAIGDENRLNENLEILIYSATAHTVK